MFYNYIRSINILLRSCAFFFSFCTVEATGQNLAADSLLTKSIEILKKDSVLNLVPNYSFENYTVCPEGCSVMPKSYFVDDWMMATLGTPDYFNICSDKSGVPNNWVGELYARSGVGYTGLIPGMYINSNQNLEEKREYIEAKLKQQLKKDEYYYLGFSTSMAGASQFAINGIGLYLSDTLVDIKNSIYHLPFQPQLLNRNNDIITTQYKWLDIGRIYKAKGSERYVLIGNFQSDEDTRSIDLKKPGCLNCSYYLFDDIYVISLGKNEKLEKFYSQSEKVMPKKYFTVYFDFDEAILKQNSKIILDSVVDMIRQNSSIQIEIKGFADSIGTEKYNKTLSEKRARNVANYLKAHATIIKKIDLEGFGTNFPVANNNTEFGRTLNRRVEIYLK